MNEEPKNFWKRPWKGPGGLLLFWLLILVAAFVIIFLLDLQVEPTESAMNSLRMSLIWATGIAITSFLLVLFIRWLCHWRNFKRFLFVVACFVTLIALFYAEEDWRGKHDWEKYKREGEAKGERFDMAGLAPAPVPDAQNFAMSPVWVAEIRCLFQKEPKSAEAWYGDRIYSPEVSNLLARLPVSVSGLTGTNWAYRWVSTPELPSGWPIARMTNLKPWQSYYRDLETTHPGANIAITPQPQSPSADVLLALSQFEPVIARLREDSIRPDSQFPLKYNEDDPAAIILPHLSILKEYAQVLQLRAIAELQNGKTDKSLSDVMLMLRLKDSVQSEPMLISHLVRIAMVNLALQPIWEGLAEHKWSDAQLVELDSSMTEFNFLPGYKLVMRGERNCDVGAIEFLRHRDLRRLRELFGITGDNGYSQLSPVVILYYLCPNGWFYQNELSICQFYDTWYLPLADEKDRRVSPAAARAADDAVGRELSHRTPENFFEWWVLPALGNAVQKFAWAQTATDLARVAITLERYRLAHGAYPESLDLLVPQFIAKLPHDIINGQPMHYHRTADGQFLLYSVGWNEVDDGGIVVLRRGSSSSVDTTQGDWVWSSSASKGWVYGRTKLQP